MDRTTRFTTTDHLDIGRKSIMDVIDEQQPGAFRVDEMVFACIGEKVNSRAPAYVHVKKMLDAMVDEGYLETMIAGNRRVYQDPNDSVLDLPDATNVSDASDPINEILIENAETVSEIEEASEATKSESATSDTDRIKGAVEMIRDTFDVETCNTAKAVKAKLTELGLPFNPNTVNTQVYRLRKEHDLIGSTSTGRKGAVEMIRDTFDVETCNTAKAVKIALDEAGEDYSPNTVNTQVYRLRKQHGLI